MKDHKLGGRKCLFCSEIVSGNSFDDHRIFCSKQWMTSDWKTEDSKNDKKWSDFDKKLADMIVNNLRKTAQLTETFANLEKCARENLEYRELVENFTYKIEEQDEQMKRLIEDKLKVGRELEILREKFALVFEENESQRQRYEILGAQLTDTIDNLEKVTAEKQLFRQKLDELQAETDEKLTGMEQSFETLPIRKMSIPRSDQKNKIITCSGAPIFLFQKPKTETTLISSLAVKFFSALMIIKNTAIPRLSSKKNT